MSAPTVTEDPNLLADIFYVVAPGRRQPRPRKVRCDKGFSARQIAALKSRFEGVIESISDERYSGDGVWFYPKPGFSDGGLHCVHEFDFKAAEAGLKRIAPCDCGDCKGGQP